MRQNPRLFRLCATVAIGALLCNAIVPAATAQTSAPPPVSSPGQPGQTQGDPPARVGRIASQTGTVSFRTSADTQWSVAQRNFPVSAGDAFWTEPDALAELEISSSRVALAGQTEFDLANLDDSGLAAVTPQGEAYFRLRDLGPNEVWSVRTPRGTVRLNEAGRYAIEAGTTEQPTLVTVIEGSAEIEGPGLSMKVGANQTATVTGSDPFEGSIGPAVRDAFVTARLNRELPRPRAAPSIPAGLVEMPGVEDLAAYGEWSDSPDDGPVWYPAVSPGWVPYREGNWAYVAPWGWTWVDSAPWGFAPFHYGRWAHFGRRWGWVPGNEPGGERRVYAPALVTFLGLSAGLAAGAAIAGHSAAWVPLGPREAFHPWYRASSRYLERINTGHATDPAGVGAFVNRDSTTSVPLSVMTGSRQVRMAARPLSAQALTAAQPVLGQQPLRPTTGTIGVTPAVARALNLAQGDPASRRAAPGPVARIQDSGNGAFPAPLRTGPRVEQPVIVRPEGDRLPARPPLSTPGTRPTGMFEPSQVRPPDARLPLAQPGTRPEGITPSEPRPREPGVPREAPARPPPPEIVRPESMFRPSAEPPRTNRPPVVERPVPEQRPPAFHQPEPPRPPPPVVEQFRPPPQHIEPPRPPTPPRIEQSRPPPPQHVEPPRMEPPRTPPPRPEPEHKKPGQP